MDGPAPASVVHKRSTSASRTKPPSRPSTPLRPSSRTSLRDSQSFTPGTSTAAFPLEVLEPAFAELSDSMADLEANFMHLQLMHESLSRFNENFAAFLYGMNMNAFCVDFPEAPIPESFKRARQNEDHPNPNPADHSSRPADVGDETFLTTDTSFIDNPPSSRVHTKFATPAPPTSRPASGFSKRGGAAEAGRGARGGAAARGGGRGTRGTRGSGIARGKPRGAR